MNNNIETKNEVSSDKARPCAIVLGEPVHDLPKDLYIPPDALEVFLEKFTGPLDLLLYLIKKENINILDIPIAQVTVQYMEYVELMKQLHIDLASDYLVMAAMLAEIKSRMLLPRPINDENDEDDPRAELVRRLYEYERYKKAADDLDVLPRMQRELFPVSMDLGKIIWQDPPQPKLDLGELFSAFSRVVARANLYEQYHLKGESLSVREYMTQILTKLQDKKFINFEKVFNITDGRLGVVVSFMAILELSRQNLLEIVQTEIYGLIYLKSIETEVEGAINVGNNI